MNFKVAYKVLVVLKVRLQVTMSYMLIICPTCPLNFAFKLVTNSY